MKRYSVVKLDSKTEKEINYGICSEDDMKLITRGYRMDSDFNEMYVRKNSRYFFMVKEIAC